MNNIWESFKNEKRLTRHYYGDLVRSLFMLAAIIMLVTLPFLVGKLPVPIYLSIFIIIVIGALAGLTNPLQKWVSILNATISLAGLSVFEYFAAKSYIGVKLGTLYFVTNQTLAIVFLFALYYSVKTIRAMYLKEKPQ